MREVGRKKKWHLIRGRTSKVRLTVRKWGGKVNLDGGLKKNQTSNRFGGGKGVRTSIFGLMERILG